MTTFYLPVDSKHTEILGHGRQSKHGKRLWDELDWSEWWIDGPAPHLFNAGGFYLHVRAKYDPAQDGDDPEKYRQYRVRCLHAGNTFRGRKVLSVTIANRFGKLSWLLRCAP